MRLSKTDTLRFSPGHCFLCRGVSAGSFVDTGIEIVTPTGRDHRVYLCEHCVKESHRVLGLVDPAITSVCAERDKAAAKADRLAAELRELKARMELLCSEQIVPVISDLIGRATA